MQSVQSEIELCRNEYKRQRVLEQIVAKRVLKRPGTKKWHLVFFFSFIPIFILCSVILCFTLRIGFTSKLLITFLVIVLTVELYLRFCLIQAVKCYQSYAKDETRRRCLCIPSCSEYAIISLKRVFPLILALLKIRKRLYVTCDGIDYKVDFPLKKMNEPSDYYIFSISDTPKASK